MQPDTIVVVTRPWHWGIVIVSDPALGGEIPIPDPARSARVWASDTGIVVPVRGAQDGMESFGGDVPWTTATADVRRWAESPVVESAHTVLHEGVLQTPTSRLSIGDADEDVVVEAFPSSTRVRVLAASDELDRPARVVIDLWDR